MTNAQIEILQQDSWPKLKFIFWLCTSHGGFCCSVTRKNSN